MKNGGSFQFVMLVITRGYPMFESIQIWPRTGRRNEHAADRLTVPWKLIARVDVPSNFNLGPKNLQCGAP